MSKSPLSAEKSSQSALEDSEEKLSAEESKGRNKMWLHFTLCGKTCPVDSTSL